MITVATVMHARNDMNDARAEYERALADMELMKLELFQAQLRYYETSIKCKQLENAYKNRHKA